MQALLSETFACESFSIAACLVQLIRAPQIGSVAEFSANFDSANFEFDRSAIFDLTCIAGWNAYVQPLDLSSIPYQIFRSFTLTVITSGFIGDLGVGRVLGPVVENLRKNRISCRISNTAFENFFRSTFSKISRSLDKDQRRFQERSR